MNFKELFRSKEAYAVFRFPEFRKYMSAKVLLTLAVQMQNVTLYWQIFDITKDALSLGLIGLSEAIPSLAVALYAGHLADKLDRRKIVLCSLFLFVLTSISLLLLSLNISKELIDDKTYYIYAVVFISGIARGFYRPANFALLTQLIPRTLYANSSAWNSTFWQGAVVTGAAVGGLIIGYMGIQASYAIALLLIIASVFMIFGIAPKPLTEQPEKQSLMSSLTSGIKFVFSSQVFLGALSLDLIAVLFGGAVALLSVFAKDILFVGPVEFGFLNAAPAVGAIFTALYLAHKPPLEKAGSNLMMAVAGFGLCMIFFALSTNFYFSLFILALSGMFDSISVVIRSSIMQMLTPENMRGRVSAVNTMFIGSSNELGAFESGLAAKWLGVVPSVVFGGCVAVFSSGIAALAAPKLRRLKLN